MKWAIQAKEEEKNKPQTFRADGWTGNQRSSQMWWRNEQELLYPEPRTEKTSELNGSGGGRGKGIRGARPFVPVGGTNRDKRGDFCPGWWFQPGQKATRAFCPGWNHQPGQKAPILSRLVSQTGTKGPRPPAGPASHWTRDKSHLLSRAQRLPGQMARNKGLFCSSGMTNSLSNYFLFMDGY